MEKVKQNKKRIDDNNSEVKVIDVKPQKKDWEEYIN